MEVFLRDNSVGQYLIFSQMPAGLSGNLYVGRRGNTWYAAHPLEQYGVPSTFGNIDMCNGGRYLSVSNYEIQVDSSGTYDLLIDEFIVDFDVIMYNINKIRKNATCLRMYVTEVELKINPEMFSELQELSIDWRADLQHIPSTIASLNIMNIPDKCELREVLPFNYENLFQIKRVHIEHSTDWRMYPGKNNYKTYVEEEIQRYKRNRIKSARN